MNDVMLDLETWGTRPGSAIRSVGAVLFDPETNATGPTFYCNVTDSSCEAAGLTRDADTVRFWDRASSEARAAFAENPQDLREVVGMFNRWWSKCAGYYVWSQGANFDEPLWSAACRAAGNAAPWKFWNSRCTRTIYAAAGLNFNAQKREGTHHNALEDALHQVRCVQRSYAIIRGRK